MMPCDRPEARGSAASRSSPLASPYRRKSRRPPLQCPSILRLATTEPIHGHVIFGSARLMYFPTSLLPSRCLGGAGADLELAVIVGGRAPGDGRRRRLRGEADRRGEEQRDDHQRSDRQAPATSLDVR